MLDWTVSHIPVEKLYHWHKQIQGAGGAKSIKCKPLEGSQFELVDPMDGEIYIYRFLSDSLYLIYFFLLHNRLKVDVAC